MASSNLINIFGKHFVGGDEVDIIDINDVSNGRITTIGMIVKKFIQLSPDIMG